MNKQQLIKEISKSTNISANKATVILNTLLQTVFESLQDNKIVNLSGLGTFKVKKLYANRRKINQSNIKIVPEFIFDKIFIEDINNNIHQLLQNISDFNFRNVITRNLKP
ncbi:hypothetical protein fh0823_20380 [Francisella halioticida]|uniref:HU family DNA-binding protein n=1 Tax=Francisella halioticida TaxID=549298 RepID=UPI001AF74B5A|nr:HU family DNA-binding protein [Francisella halioticida]BCD91899.1 hypothetical protein fh0823_20380 [Francisella halioticida]